MTGAISSRVLVVTLGVEGVLVVAALLVIAFHALWLCRRERADRPRLLRGRTALADLVDTSGPFDAALSEGPEMKVLRRLPRRVQRAVVEQLAVSVTGEEGRRVTAVAEELGLVAAARRRCSSPWWWRRLLGAYQLNIYRPDDDTRLNLLDDRNAAVRSQAIEWAGDARRADLASRLAAALHDRSALCRYTAADSILRTGALIVDCLVSELDDRTGLEQARLMRVLARRPDPRYRDAAIAAAGDADLPPRRAAAAGLLGAIGSPDAGDVLVGLLSDGDASVRAAAAEALRKLGYTPAAPALVPLLRDPDFTVRRAAGAALAGIGPAGTLLLRHHVDDDDCLASDMARYSLDVAALFRSEPGG